MHAKMRAWLGAATILLIWQSQPVAAFLSESTQNRNQLIATNACQNCLLTEVDLSGLNLSDAN
jgi:hypothetical protein